MKTTNGYCRCEFGGVIVSRFRTKCELLRPNTGLTRSSIIDPSFFLLPVSGNHHPTTAPGHSNGVCHIVRHGNAPATRVVSRPEAVVDETNPVHLDIASAPSELNGVWLRPNIVRWIDRTRPKSPDVGPNEEGLVRPGPDTGLTS